MAQYATFDSGLAKAVRQSLVHILALAAATSSLDPWHTVGGGGGEPPFIGAWVNEGAPWQVAQFRKEGDLVRLRGVVQSGSGDIFTLPVRYRPPAGVKFLVVGNTTTTASTVMIEASTGNVTLMSGSVLQMQLDLCFSITA